MAVVNITELSNSNTLGNLLSIAASPALVKTPVMMANMTLENLPSGTNVVKFRKNGSLTGALVAESTANAVDSNGELTDSSISATAAKAIVVSGLSVEEQQFGYITLDRIATEQGTAIGRYVDNDALSMASGLATSVTCASVATVDDLMLAQMNIYNSNCPNQEVPLSAILGPRAVYNIKKDILQSGGTPWANPAMLDIFAGAPVKANGLIGTIPGFGNVFQTTGFATSSGDDVQMVIHPIWCLAGIFASAPVTWVQNRGAEGFYTEVASYYFYDVIEWNDLCGVKFLSDT